MTGYDAALLLRQVITCRICSGLVLRVVYDEHLEWHKTMTNLPADEQRNRHELRA